MEFTSTILDIHSRRQQRPRHRPVGGFLTSLTSECAGHSGMVAGRPDRRLGTGKEIVGLGP